MVAQDKAIEISARILVVEDQILFAKDLAGSLKNFGYEISGMTSSAEEALRIVEQAKPDLVLMNINLGGEIDGIEAAEQIRARFDIPVVYLTGYEERDVLERAKNTEPYGYLRKPVSSLELRSAIETALYKHDADMRVKESERRYHTLVETMAEGVILQDSQYVIRSYNRAAESILGVPADQVLGKSSFDVTWRCIREDGSPYPVEDHPSTITLRTGKAFTEAIMGILHEEETIWISINTRPLFRDDENLPYSVVISFSDITGRKRAEEARRESDERFRAVFDNAGVGIGVTDCQGRWITVNAAFREFLGYEEQEFRQLTSLDITHPEDRDTTVDLILDLVEKRIPTYRLEKRYIKKDGTVAWGDVSICPIHDVHGNIVFLTGAVSDITERKKIQKELHESQQMLQLVLDAIPAAVFWKDRDCVYLGGNRAWRETVGLSSSQEVVGKSDYDFPWDKEQADSFREDDRRVMESGIAEYDIVETYRRADGTQAWAKTNKVPLRDIEGNIVGILGTYEDITERRKAEEERQNFRNQLVQAQKMEAIGTLTGGVAHDFNNLLTIINGYTEMILLDKTEDDPNYQDLQKILETGRKGAEMVRRLRAFSKRAETNPQPLDLNRIIQGTIKLMERTFPKMIEIETDLSNDLGMINADAGQVEQAFMNLCINATEAMPEGGRLRIETRKITLDEDYCRLHLGVLPGRYIRLEVSDTGVGIDKETIGRIFDPFFTTKGWDFRKGTGLGLSVTKGIVEQHGGWITCQSDPGVGTTFKVHFPPMETSPESAKPEAYAGTVGGIEKILLVDDEEYVRDLGKRILVHAGYAVITAANGTEALEIYAREQSNTALIVLDLIMPGMGGTKCLEELLKINSRVKVVVSTGHPLDSKEREHVGSLARGFVNKPYDMKQLLQTVREILDAD